MNNAHPLDAPMTSAERLRVALAISEGRDREFECEPEYLEALLADYDRLRAALGGVIAAWVNPADGSPFEQGEVPALDAARAALA